MSIRITGTPCYRSVSLRTTIILICRHSTRHSSWTPDDTHKWASKLEAMNEFTDRMKSTLYEPHTALAKLKDDMARYYNQQ